MNTVMIFVAVSLLTVIKATTAFDITSTDSSTDALTNPVEFTEQSTVEEENTHASSSKDPLQTATHGIHNQESSTSPPCPTCKRGAEQIIDEELERQRRVEQFKRTILAKLGLKVPPNITTPVNNLPDAIFQSDYLQQPNHRSRPVHVIDDHIVEETTSKLYRFADEGW